MADEIQFTPEPDPDLPDAGESLHGKIAETIMDTIEWLNDSEFKAEEVVVVLMDTQGHVVVNSNTVTPVLNGMLWTALNEAHTADSVDD